MKYLAGEAIYLADGEYSPTSTLPCTVPVLRAAQQPVTSDKSPLQDPLPRNPRLLTRYNAPRVTGVHNSMRIIHGRMASSHVGCILGGQHRLMYRWP